MKFWRPLLPLIFAVPMHASAGQLTLESGDSISGDLQGIEGDVVRWRSQELGDLRIAKTTIKSINADTPLKIRGKDVPCVWLALVENDNVMFRCADGEQPSFPLLALEHVIPFRDHRQTNFAFNGEVRASGWRQSGNTEGKFWESYSKVTLRHSDIRHIVTVTYNGQQIESFDSATDTTTVTLRTQLLGVYTLDWFFVPQWYLANKISGERDDNRNIQEEYVIGVGLGYQFWESASTALALELGLDQSMTYLRDNPSEDEPEAYTSVRLANNFRYTFENGFNLYNKNEYTEAINSLAAGKTDRWRVRTETGIQMPIGFGISAVFSARWDFVNYAKDLDPNASRTDTTYRVGVNYAW